MACYFEVRIDFLQESDTEHDKTDIWGKNRPER